jgi:hypothetical protein
MDRARRGRASLALALALGEAACASSSPSVPKTPAVVDDAAAQARRLEEFARIEGQALDWIAASDPRLALRSHVVASDEVLAKIGTDAVLAEDAAAQIRDRSLDLFAFRARAHALERRRESSRTWPRRAAGSRARASSASSWAASSKRSALAPPTRWGSATRRGIWCAGF